MRTSMFDIKLASHNNGRLINATGGMAMVVSNGGFQKVALTDRNGVTLANPVALVNGNLEFYTVDTIDKVDLYIMCPNGEFIVRKNVVRSGSNEFFIDETVAYQVAMIPFHAADYTAASEGTTGILLPIGAAMFPTGVGLYMGTADATEDADVGLLSSESGGDADGFMDGISTAGTGPVFTGVTISTSWPSATTLGLLLRDFTAGSTTDDRGSYIPKVYVVGSTARSVSLTLSTGSDTAAGLILLPYMKPPANFGATN